MENDITQTHKNFVAYWKSHQGRERQDCHIFWIGLLREFFGVEEPRDLLAFEKDDDLATRGYIDIYIEKNKVIIEQKSALKDLAAKNPKTDLTPYEQAKRYNDALIADKKARWIVTCNFCEFWIYDLNKTEPEKSITKLSLNDLPKKYYLLDFIVDSERHKLRVDQELSLKAAELVGKLYDALRAQYADPDSRQTLENLNKLCVRLIFLVYADKINAFSIHDKLYKWLDGSRNFRADIIKLFEILNTPENLRDKNEEDDFLRQIPYVDGGLFEESIEIPKFSKQIKIILLNEIYGFDWSEITPSIFGTVFESTIDPPKSSKKPAKADADKIRHAGGMHYTAPQNILKVIKPLFLDDFYAEFDAAKKSSSKADFLALQNKLAQIKIFDPACGSGNFLTESYIRLRELENNILKEIYGQQTILDLDDIIKVKISQFFGIEINDFACRVAETALWISEIKMRRETAEIVHQNYSDFPIRTHAHIIEANALRVDWQEIIPAAECSFIISNPPFVSAKGQTPAQKADILALCPAFKPLDYVTGWYKKASDFIHLTNSRAAFVSTNSICQGEQVAPLWQNLDVHIDFAFLPFKWYSESADMAQVHVVVIGFSHAPNPKPKKIFRVEFFKDDKGKRGEKISCTFAQNINGYLLDAPNIYVKKSRAPICDAPEMRRGSCPTDGGNLIIEAKDYDAFVKAEPLAKKYIRPYIGTEEYINNKKRYCLWLVDCPPHELYQMKKVMKRLKAVREYRLKSPKAATRKDAETPALFQEIKQPNTNYIIIPRISSENRRYIPIGFMTPDIIVRDAAQLIPDATLYHFGVLTSSVHMAWMRVVCGRLEMRYNYSATIVYNNFPWCAPSAKQRAAIEATAAQILEVRAQNSDSSLAALYSELAMPKELRAAHKANDAAVMKAYGFSAKLSEAEIVSELFKMYVELTRAGAE